MQMTESTVADHLPLSGHNANMSTTALAEQMYSGQQPLPTVPTNEETLLSYVDKTQSPAIQNLFNSGKKQTISVG